MKHAYLIIAHNEFEVLSKLITVLDDPRNDIYLHFDKKVENCPLLQTQHAKLQVLEERQDIRWGSVSQIEAEYLLFEAALADAVSYERLHLISGTHFPLKTQDDIHAFFQQHQGKEVLNFLYTNSYEIDMKLARYHFFLNYFQYGKPWIRRIANLCWHVILKLQYIFSIRRQAPDVHIKANNWVSLTEQAVRYIVSRKKDVLRKFRWSLCGDEFFVPYLLADEKSGFTVVNEGKLLFNEFEGSNPRVLTMDDYTFLIDSDYLFARKVSQSGMSLVDKLVETVKKDV
ncbi:beta-1,6-N-acetylglucosaminyltransferase [Sphingobacterium deserti]|uniref:Peptide O-xylosyltransferase n=1 Tax=Sphingobacterium deserti TaxID=1229276 RepID=A0A0B8T749_9SPHI|nr:beta-1,6-N-acetylglucosaminyltransferase [Sphingobacterium deserti]KGE14154.1 putative glycosyltransferase [Sphingobacterium deserti]